MNTFRSSCDEVVRYHNDIMESENIITSVFFEEEDNN